VPDHARPFVALAPDECRECPGVLATGSAPARAIALHLGQFQDAHDLAIQAHDDLSQVRRRSQPTSRRPRNPEAGLRDGRRPGASAASGAGIASARILPAFTCRIAAAMLNSA
jgi:hypothetical protein